MTIRVLVVDDSTFFQRRITDIINAHGQLEVVGVAANGREAVEMNQSLKPDVITLDFEMPVMDGLTALQIIMKERPVPVLMLSSLTTEGARITLDALDAGAVDYLPKIFEDFSQHSSDLRRQLTGRILEVAKRRKTPECVLPHPSEPGRLHNTEVVAIGTSTGGPAALKTILSALPPTFDRPVILVQHMPASFTAAFAQRLNKICRLTVKEAEDGEPLKKGVVYVAPGDKQLIVSSSQGLCLRVRDSDERVNYRPCIDITFASIAANFGARSLGIILTGMGHDGTEGCRLMKEQGGTVWTQDEASAVISTMPKSVREQGFSDLVLSLNEFGERIATEVC